MFKVKVMEVKDGPRMDFRWMETEQDPRGRRLRPQAKGMLVEQYIKCKRSLWERIFGGALYYSENWSVSPTLSQNINKQKKKQRKPHNRTFALRCEWRDSW